MATIYAFRALRYDPARVLLPQVLTQPYDKITPAMQERYYASSPYNLVRVVLGKTRPDDNEEENVYIRAASYISDWRQKGILREDTEPSIYVYSQRFAPPGKSFPIHERRGFIALGKVQDYTDRTVFRHEQTLSQPKADRLNLLRATRAHFGQVFMLYSDPLRELDSLLVPAAPPITSVVDEYGTQHCLWRISDPVVIERVRSYMGDKKLIIADGHHRYETAINYRNERRLQCNEVTQSTDNAPWERMMMTFINMDSPGLLILPTHRVVFGLPHLDPVQMIEKIRPFFVINPLNERVDGTHATQLLKERGQDKTAFLAITPRCDYILESRPEPAVYSAASELFAGISPRQRRLDLVKLHRIVLEYALELSENDIINQRYIHYFRDADEAIVKVQSGADVAFLMNPVPIQQVREIALAGEVLPQKSTDFYPKLLTGLTMYALE